MRRPRPGIASRRLALGIAALCAGAGVRGLAQASGRPATLPDQLCPDATDTRELLNYYVGLAYRAYSADPARRLPAPCLVIAIAKTPLAYPDSTVAKTLEITEGLLKGQPDIALLNAHLALLYRLRRFSDARAAFDALAATDSSGITAYAYRIAIAATRRGADTVTALRYLAAASGQFPAISQFAAEYRILSQVGRMRALIDTIHRAMKSASRRTGGYASLASIYGSLEEPDSAFAYIRKGLAAHAPRSEMATALESLIQATSLHAQVLDAPDAWDATLRVAFAADSALSTQETKHFVALSIARVVSYRIDSLNFYLPDVQLGELGSFESIDISRMPASNDDLECPSIATVLHLVAIANARLASGGSKVAAETLPAIRSALDTVAARVAPLQRGCAGGSYSTAPRELRLE